MHKIKLRKLQDSPQNLTLQSEKRDWYLHSAQIFYICWIILWWFQSLSIHHKGIVGGQLGHSYSLATPVNWDKSHSWMPLITPMSHKWCHAQLSSESQSQMAKRFAKQPRLILLIIFVLMSGDQIMSVISIPTTDIKSLQQRLQCAWKGIHYAIGLTNVSTIKENINRIINRKKEKK